MVKWLIPSGIMNFECKMCGGCCKNGWDILIRKPEYDKLKKIVDKDLFHETVAILPKDYGSGTYYAKLCTNDGGCGLQQENNLCKIHKNYGLKYLPNVCTIYPRHIFITPRGFEMSLGFSCPATETILLSKEHSCNELK